jgi:hypothetical protein
MEIERPFLCRTVEVPHVLGPRAGWACFRAEAGPVFGELWSAREPSHAGLLELTSALMLGPT